MLALDSGLWTLKRLAGMPMAWLGFSLNLALWPLIVIFSPLTLTMTPNSAGQLVIEVSWFACLLATIVALGPLSQNSWLLAQAAPLRAQAARGFAVLAAGAIGVVAGMTGAIAFGKPLNLPWAAISTSVVLSLAHHALLGLWVLTFPIPLIWRSLSLALFAWALPALASSQGAWGERLGKVFGTPHPINALQDLTLNGLLELLLPIGALALIVALTPLPRVRFVPDQS